MLIRTMSLMALLILSGCTTSAGPVIQHVVIFKLNDPDDGARLIAESDRMLSDLPGLRNYYAGSPLDTGRGGPVDLDFDVFISMSFDSVGAYETYLRHPQHVQITSEWRPRLEWVRVYDAISRTNRHVPEPRP